MLSKLFRFVLLLAALIVIVRLGPDVLQRFGEEQNRESLREMGRHAEGIVEEFKHLSTPPRESSE